MERVVITGMGAITPVGNDVPSYVLVTSFISWFLLRI